MPYVPFQMLTIRCKVSTIETASDIFLFFEFETARNCIQLIADLRTNIPTEYSNKQLSFSLTCYPKYKEHKVEQVGTRYSCLHAVTRFHHFHPSMSYQGILLSGG